MNLTESLSSKVYHLTYPYSAVKILSDNEIKLSTSAGSEWDNKFQKGKLFFLSTSRTKSAKFKSGSDSGVVFLHLNGTQLNNNFKATQVNYWSGDKNATDEFEDRLITDKSVIDNAKKYITRVDILLPNDWDKRSDLFSFIKDPDHDKFTSRYSPEYMKHIGSTRQIQPPTLNNHGQWKDIITIIKECKKSNIQVELYKNVSKFRSNVGPGDVSLSELSDVIRNLYNIRKGTDTKLYRGGVTTADRENFRNTNLHKAKSQHPWYIILMKLYESDINDNIPTYYIDYIARHGWNGRDQIYSAQADIHNMRSDLPRHLKRFLITLKKSKLSLTDFYKSLYEKWKPKLNY